MATITLTPTTTTHLRDASFSSYLNCSEEAYVRKLADENFSEEAYVRKLADENFRFGRKKAGEDGEIDVFGAEKYFNEGEPPRVFKNSGGDFARNEIAPVKVSSQPPRTPSVCSESSSWNSQSALLKSALNKKPPHHHKRRSRSLLTSIRCINCSCNDNKSVDIDVTTTSVPINKAELNPWIMKQIQTQKMDETGRGLRKEEGFTFPVLSSKLGISPQENEILPKKPQELFAMERKKHSLNLDRRTAVLPWNPTAGMYEEDTESDASSDLFEIEDIRSNGKGSFLYAPSEASIEWSVVTASAADFEELVMPAEEDSGGYKMSSNGKKTEKWRSGGILSGCKSQKAVMVAGDAYRTNGNEKVFAEQRMAYRSDSFGRGTRFQEEARKSSFDLKNKHYSFDLGALSRWQT